MCITRGGNSTHYFARHRELKPLRKINILWGKSATGISSRLTLEVVYEPLLTISLPLYHRENSGNFIQPLFVFLPSFLCQDIVGSFLSFFGCEKMHQLRS